jgi:hypothetical protein
VTSHRVVSSVSCRHFPTKPCGEGCHGSDVISPASVGIQATRLLIQDYISCVGEFTAGHESSTSNRPRGVHQRWRSEQVGQQAPGGICQ